MNVSPEALKNAKKKRATTEGGAPQLKKAVSKKPLVAIGGPSASARTLTSCLIKAPSVVDDDEMEIFLAPTPIAPTSSPALAPLAIVVPPLAATSRWPSPLD